MNFTDLAEKHKLFRRIALIWAIVLITWVVIKVFTSPPDIPSGTVTALSIIVGLLATVIGFYNHTRHNDDQSNNREGP